MKKTIFFCFNVFVCAIVQSQTYNSPESIEYDYANNRWFISNNGDGKILTRNSLTGVLSDFASGIVSGPHGLEIMNDTLYVCDGPRLQAYNINTPLAPPIFSLNLGASFLNGITSDNSSNLYITDFSAKKIYRFNILTRQFNVFASTGTKTPNGILYDQSNSRCLFVTWGSSAAIMQLNLSDSTVSTAQTTSLSNCDGISRDLSGNYYVSSWGLNGITRFTSSLSTPVTVVSGLSSPADIFYNVLTDTLGVPNSGTSGINGNKASFHYLGISTGIDEKEIEHSFNIFPNPAFGLIQCDLLVEEEGLVTINLYNQLGQLSRTLLQSKLAIGKKRLIFDLHDVVPGVYFVQLLCNNKESRRKLILHKP